MFSDLLKTRVRHDVQPIGLALAGLGLSPNAISFVGFLLNSIVAVVLATGHLTLAGVLLLPVAAFDVLDGAVARATGRTTRFGAFLDSTLDRYEEAVLLVAVLIVYAPLGDALINSAIFAALIGSFMVSYTRARAEGLGMRCEVGIAPRPERIIIMAIGLVFGLIIPALWLLAVLSNLTAVQRMLHVWKATRRE